MANRINIIGTVGSRCQLYQVYQQQAARVDRVENTLRSAMASGSNATVLSSFYSTFAQTLKQSQKLKIGFEN